MCEAKIRIVVDFVHEADLFVYRTLWSALNQLLRLNTPGDDTGRAGLHTVTKTRFLLQNRV